MSDNQKLYVDLIVKDDCVYVAPFYNANEYLFDGVRGEETNKKKWLKLQKVPQLVEKVISQYTCNEFRLKPGFIASSKMPETLPSTYFTDDAEDDDENEYAERLALRPFYDSIEISVKENRKPFDIVFRQIASRKTDWKLVDVPPNVSYSLITEIETHPDLLQDEPCYLSENEVYQHVRNQIKLRIDNRYALVSSDYDFCFSVKKVIRLVEPYKVTILANKNIKKPKFVERFTDKKEVEVFRMAPKPYHDYPVVEAFTGETWVDLERKINQYVDELIEKINRPMQECPCCRGAGIVEMKEVAK